MRSIDETRDFLKTLSQVVAERLDHLKGEGADRQKIERERWRQKLIADSLLAIEETLADFSAN